MASGTCGDNSTWSLNESTGVLTVSGSGAIDDYFGGTNYVSGHPLYNYRSTITSIVIEDGITSIGQYAFYLCSSLTSVTIGNGVMTIGDSAFLRCTALIGFDVNVDNMSYKDVDGVLFTKDGTQLILCPGGKSGSYDIPEGVTAIGDEAFSYCSSLTSVTIPDSVTTIGVQAFTLCSSLTEITFKGNQPTMGKQSFMLTMSSSTPVTATVYTNGWGSDDVFTTNIKWNYTTFTYKTAIFGTCGDNATWKLIDGVLTVSGTGAIADYFGGTNHTTGHTLYNYRSTITSIVINSGITSIGEHAFYQCSSLTSVTIPDSVTSIGDAAFGGCSSLTSVTLPDSVTSIGSWVFQFCSTLTSVTIGVGVTTIGTYAFALCSSLTEITFKGNQPTMGTNSFMLTMSSSTPVTATVYTNGWGSDDVFTTVIRGDYTTFTYKTAIFGTCGDNATWMLDESTGVLTIIGTGAMYDYTTSTHAPWYDYSSTITGVVIEDGITSIGDYAFRECTAIISVTIGNGVTSIGDYAFSGCSSLKNFIVSENNNAYSSDGFGVLFDKDKTILIQYPKGNERTSYAIPDTVTSIGNNAFSFCNSLKSMTIPDTVTSIERSAFWGCESLTSVTIGNGVTSIGENAFYYCSSLTSVTIPDSVTTIGDFAFQNCDALTSVIIGNGVTSIGQSAFSECTSLTSVIIGNSVTTIGYSAFSECTSLTSVIIPDSVTSISSPFYNCTSLTSVTLGAGITSFDYHDFYICDALTEIIISDGNPKYKDIDGVWFTKDGTGLIFYPHGKSGSYVFPKGITSIGDYAFYEFSSITSVTIPNTVTSIGKRAFFGCSSLTSVTIGAGVTSIGEYAFTGSTSLNSVIFKGDSAPTTLGINAFSLGNGLKDKFTVYIYTKGWGSNDVFTNRIRGFRTTLIYELLPSGSTVHVNVNGEWKEATPYVNVNGEWKEVVATYVNVGGIWKETV